MQLQNSVPIVDCNEGGALLDTKVVTEQIQLEEMDVDFTPTTANELSRSIEAGADAMGRAGTSLH